MRILTAIAMAGAEGATDAELTDRLWLLENSERPRRVELVEAGWITDSGQRRPHGRHSDGIVWQLTDEGARDWNASEILV